MFWFRNKKIIFFVSNALLNEVLLAFHMNRLLAGILAQNLEIFFAAKFCLTFFYWLGLKKRFCVSCYSTVPNIFPPTVLF